MFRRVTEISYKIHLIVALVIRLGLIAYSEYHDRFSIVSYTDIDYKVFTDASRHILNHKSPYNRLTYRYSPLIAFLLIPNVILHQSFGKLLFSLFDLIDAFLIRSIVRKAFENHINDDSSDEQTELNSVKKSRKRSKHLSGKFHKIYTGDDVILASNIAMLVWLYNPLTIAISTRGNCDSIAGFLVLVTLYLIQNSRRYFWVGLIHGCSIHFRLYPLAYSLAYFMYLSKFSYYSINDRRQPLPRLPNNYSQLNDSNQSTNQQLTASNNRERIEKEIVENIKETPERRTIFKLEYLMYLVPNSNQIQLISGCFLSLIGLTSLFYYLYGYQFIYETYFYHLIRKDPRHNFSLYFYLQYLTAGVKNIGLWQKVLVVLPQIVLLLVFSIRYGLNRYSLNFSILTQTIVIVTFNTVLTSQYFTWILVVLPLCLWQLKLSIRNVLFFVCIWFAAQLAWLLPAYFLEFHGQNTFLFIWIQSVSLFCAHIAILGRLIMNFKPLMKEKCE